MMRVLDFFHKESLSVKIRGSRGYKSMNFQNLNCRTPEICRYFLVNVSKFLGSFFEDLRTTAFIH